MQARGMHLASFMHQHTKEPTTGVHLASCPFAAPLLFSGRASLALCRASSQTLQQGRGGRLIFQQDFLLEEMTEPLRFGFNPFSDRAGG
jgi:hypothetical protein